jgi:hypothetical protein
VHLDDPQSYPVELHTTRLAIAPWLLSCANQFLLDFERWCCILLVLAFYLSPQTP